MSVSFCRSALVHQPADALRGRLPGTLQQAGRRLLLVLAGRCDAHRAGADLRRVAGRTVVLIVVVEYNEIAARKAAKVGSAIANVSIVFAASAVQSWRSAGVLADLLPASDRRSGR